MNDHQEHPAHDFPLQTLALNPTHLKDLEYICELASMFLKDSGGQWPERINHYRSIFKQLITPGAEMTHQEHLDRHRFLHRCLDELIADWMGHTRHLATKSTVRDLMQWSFEQSQNPTEYDDEVS